MGGSQVAAWLLLGWIVLIATVVAYMSGVTSVRRLSPQVAGVVACLEAVVATVLAWVLLGEHLSPAQTVGGVVVLVGAFIAQTSTPKAPSVQLSPAAANDPSPAAELSPTRTTT
jgi:drug/metabolite transporter (DMT)-like permease